ncbi:CD209 antigen-like [Branchiostoma lanceolatum]|uniref:CD209 antigen-like n=1 Tax=Branchiostoma lanceolatum TaxID=7740 RepID=UPI00345722AE
MCYKFATDEKTYSDAKSSCRATGGHLAMPKDQATNDFLVKQIKDSFPSKYIFPWIGLTAQVQEGTWVWDDGTALGTGQWNNWDPGYPRHLDPHSTQTRCAAWLPNYSYKWIDHFACTYAFYYICEVKANAAP